MKSLPAVAYLQSAGLIIALLAVSVATVGVLPAGAAETVLRQQKIERAVSFLFEILDGGVIEGELINTTRQRVSDVEVLVRYSWIWHREPRDTGDDPSWSTSFTFPVELDPGQSSPLSIPPIQPMTERDDGYFRITAKVMGYTRYRWVNEPEIQGAN